jgi:hypothetical protein
METYIEKLKAIDTKIKSDIIDESDGSKVILDGINDLEEYSKVDLKILWILKEPRCDSGGWDMRDALNNMETDKRTGWRHTFDKIIYSSYGILNDFTSWNDMDYIRNNPSMKRVLKSIAYINLKKLPNTNQTSFSDDNEILTAYNKDKSIILSQINLFNPDIIICGGTLKFLKNDLNLFEENSKHSGDTKYYIQNNKIYIQAFHPSYWAKSQVTYCDEIINAVKLWCNQKP